MNHIQVKVFATPHEQEILIAQLSEAGAAGFEETDTYLLSYFSEDSYHQSLVDQILTGIKKEISVMEARNWNALWESNFEPVIVEDFCAIRAHFHKPVEHVNIEVVITPKMSFGTGHHATTYMMIQQMKEIDFTNCDVFDFGTGTGILAILAKKLGAKGIIAIDVDEWSINNAAENFERNGVSEIILHQSTVLPAGNFDIILANINKNVLLQYAKGLKERIRGNGYLLLSGIMVEDETEIYSSFCGDPINVVRRIQSGNWLSLLFLRQPFSSLS